MEEEMLVLEQNVFGIFLTSSGEDLLLDLGNKVRAAPNCSVARLKVRLASKGFTQTYSIVT